MAKEKRKSFRLKDNLAVFRCSQDYLLETNFLTQDISQDGICLFTKSKIDIGQTLKLAIYVPEEKTPIIAEGRVLRRNETDNPDFPYLIALEFTNIDQASCQRVLKHIRFFLLKS